MKCKLFSNKGKSTTFASNSKIGDLLLVIDTYNNGTYYNHVILHIYNGFVSLTNPNTMWDSGCTLEVRFLEEGESVLLTP